jgi:hypothetical protein
MTKAEAARLNGKKGGRPRGSTRVPAPGARPSWGTPNGLGQPIHPTPHENPPVPVPVNPEGLSPRELLFVAAYCGPANFNATTAYALAGYRRSTANACRLIGRDRIGLAIARKVAERTQRLQAMAGDEALERLTRVGRSTIRELLPPGHYLRASGSPAPAWGAARFGSCCRPALVAPTRLSGSRGRRRAAAGARERSSNL